VFENVVVVAVAFKSAFHSEMHQNNIFLKILFLISAQQNDSKTLKKILILNKTK
jgi:hypothetical protein